MEESHGTLRFLLWQPVRFNGASTDIDVLCRAGIDEDCEELWPPLDRRVSKFNEYCEQCEYANMCKPFHDPGFKKIDSPSLSPGSISNK